MRRRWNLSFFLSLSPFFILVPALFLSLSSPLLPPLLSLLLLVLFLLCLARTRGLLFWGNKACLIEEGEGEGQRGGARDEGGGVRGQDSSTTRGAEPSAARRTCASAAVLSRVESWAMTPSAAWSRPADAAWERNTDSATGGASLNRVASADAPRVSAEGQRYSASSALRAAPAPPWRGTDGLAEGAMTGPRCLSASAAQIQARPPPPDPMRITGLLMIIMINDNDYDDYNMIVTIIIKL